MVKKALLLFGLVFFITGIGYSQEIYDSILTALNKKYPQEKIYIQTDKTYYNPGETVWMKAYVKSDNFPANISTNIYMELLNAQSKIITRKIMPINLMGAHFDFEIPDSIKSTRLYLRAYTSWMLNFNNDHYVKALNVVQHNTTKTEQVKTYTLNFFPEGGDLVADIESRIAFKTNDSEGLPFAIKGTIVNEEGKNIGSFQSVHDGMGYFSLKPQANKKYKAIWKDALGKQHETLLPASKNEGAILSIDKKENTVLFTIKRTAHSENTAGEYIIVGQMHQQITYAARINFRTKTEVTVSLPTDSLEDGILQLTLFNNKQQPVAERIVFINNNFGQFFTDVRINKKDLRAKAKNEIQIDVGGTLKSNLSLSITDDVQSPQNVHADNILSQLLMSADLKGYVHNAGYYFSSDADSVKQHLDLVMMTNGWRRFNWQDLLANKWPEIKYMPDNYLSVEGNVYGLSSGELLERSITGFLQTNKELNPTSIISIPANKDGSFKVDRLYFFDTAKIYYQLNNDKNKRLTEKASFNFKSGFLNAPAIAVPANLNFAPPLAPALAASNAKNFKDLVNQIEKENKRLKLLENVTVSGKIKTPEQKLDEEYASGLFSSSNSRMFAVDNDPLASVYRTVLDYLQGKVAGLQITINGFSGTVTRRGSSTSIFLNEMQTDVDAIMSISMSDVAYIKVMDPPFMGAAGGGAGGAIAVYTKKGGGSNANVQGLNIAVLQGYSKFKEFYSPDYDRTFSDEPDLRTTLYWNPTILLDEKNKRMIIPFFNNSSAKKIRVVIEGINERGQVSREVKVFE